MGLDYSNNNILCTIITKYKDRCIMDSNNKGLCICNLLTKVSMLLLLVLNSNNSRILNSNLP